jgi:transketolase
VIEGNDITLISTGAMLKTTVDAAEALSEIGIKARVLSMHTLKPIDRKAILDAANETGNILTIEEHSHIGGLGGAVAEIIAEETVKKVCFKRLALPSEFSKHIGNQDYLRSIYGLTVDGIVESTSFLLKNKRKNDQCSLDRLPIGSNRSFIDHQLERQGINGEIQFTGQVP